MINSYRNFLDYLDVSRETYEKICLYDHILTNWQKKMNLVSNTSIENSLLRHFIDSGQLYKLLKKHSGVVIDIGSGAGFPGMVLAIMGIKDMYLIESNKKKCNFLCEISKQTNTEVKIFNMRFENFQFVNPTSIISRAVAPMYKLLDLCFKYCGISNLNSDCKKLPNLLFLKGKNYHSELSILKPNQKIEFQVLNSISGGGGKILYYKKKNNE